MDDSKETFFNELEELYKKYNLTISHEDCHGGFILAPYNDWNIEWIRAAADERSFDRWS